MSSGAQKMVQVFDPEGNLLAVEDNRDLATTKAAAREEVNRYRDVVLDLGIHAFGHKWDSDARSRQNFTGIVAAVAVGFQVPEGFMWRDFDNVNVPVTTPMLVTLGTLLLSYVSQVFGASWVIKGLIDNAPNLAALDAINLYAGWPDGDMDGSMPPEEGARRGSGEMLQSGKGRDAAF